MWSVLAVCRNCGVHEQCWVCMVYMVCMVCWSLEILLLLNVVDMDEWNTVE